MSDVIDGGVGFMCVWAWALHTLQKMKGIVTFNDIFKIIIILKFYAFICLPVFDNKLYKIKKYKN